MGFLLVALQRVGQAFMLPVAVLPVAGLLLGVGSANLPFIPKDILIIMQAAGGSIFTILPLLFAVATTIAFTKMDGASALATLVGYYVFLATMGVTANLIGMETTTILGIKSIDVGVLGGIIVGFLGAFVHNRYSGTQLPEYLGFFSGRRFVPIVMACFCVFLGLVFPFIWKPIGAVIKAFTDWAAYQSPIVAFTAYGFFERLLIPTGLQHILNAVFFFEVGSFTTATGEVVHGDTARFLAGDTTAGYLGGSYLFKMWGLPGAAMAMIYTARPENRKKVASLMIPAAFTSFLTGITEPIEFSFLFVAPMLYLVHAFLVASAYIVTISLGIHHSVTFSQGFFDYIFLYSHSQRGWLLVPLGILYAGIYFSVFTVLIKAFNFKTPGREVEEFLTTKSSSEVIPTSDEELAKKIIIAYGGKGNITNLESCISRLRVTVNDASIVNKEELKRLGAKGVVTVGAHDVQSIFGTKSDVLRKLCNDALNNMSSENNLQNENNEATKVEPEEVASVVTKITKPSFSIPEIAQKVVDSLGSKHNIVKYENCLTRIRVEVADKSKINLEPLIQIGAKASIVSGHSIHIVFGKQSDAIAKHIAKL